jgi:chemotaxis protein methyltransferase CheR
VNLQHNQAAAAPKPRESGPAAGSATLSDRDFARLAERVRTLTGIVLPPHKRQLVISRLRKRLRALGLDGFGAYLAYLASPAGAAAETGEMINAVTTNQTGFFREGHHFEDLARILAQPPGNTGERPRRRIWSAACSTGEEAYSIALTVLGAGLAGPGAGLRILATDLDTAALTRARAATYPAGRVDACPPQLRQGYFETLPDGRLRVTGGARKLITFNRLNLHGSWPVQGPFDAIFCRNVLIYFSPEAKQSIVGRCVDLLRPGGTLYLGHSEAMLGDHPQLVNQGRTIFRRCP